MAEVADNYDTYYADKLWGLLPAIYRTEDTDVFNRNGPLREMVNRIGAQVAIVRRSMDRLWEDQSIETCDDWVIPYIADLLATNLVSSLDGRGQRLDVAKTIYYRRRKGTVAILEEIAADITGWDARVVEFFRRLGRTRHNLDPEIGQPSATDKPLGARGLQQAEGLIGRLTGTAIGGWADVRNVYGATKASTAFDEYFHSADMRRGRGAVGWYNIPRLGIFLWRLYSFPVTDGTPVAVDGCARQFTFNPTGREIPLFAAASRGPDAYGDAWVSPEEWQLPAPISKLLLDAIVQHRYADVHASLYPESLEVRALAGSFYDQVPPDKLTIWPELGRFTLAASLGDPDLRVGYHYGFSSEIGADPTHRRVLRERAVVPPDPVQPVMGGGNALVGPLAGLGATGTIRIGDSLTYTAVSNMGGPVIANVAIQAANLKRPVIRIQGPAEWRFSGKADGALTLEGLFVSGCDIVLSGDFDTVRLRCCTLDPGNAAAAPNVFAQSLDGRDLVPCHLWVEGGTVRTLVIDRCITGPIRTRTGGTLERLIVTDSILQAIRSAQADAPFDLGDLKDAAQLTTRLRERHDPLSTYIYNHLPTETQQWLDSYTGPEEPTMTLRRSIVSGLNSLLSDTGLYDADRFELAQITPAAQQLHARNPPGEALLRLNRMLLEEAYPAELADSTMALHEGEVHLERCTVLGPANVHRLEASECILDDVVQVEDVQHGCVRFSAWSTGSILPRQYESVEIAPQSPIFTTREFGQPGYAQLLTCADAAIVSGAIGATLSEGAQNGSEMGAFARELHPIKERSLRIKYGEFMPIGLIPVIIYAT